MTTKAGSTNNESENIKVGNISNSTGIAVGHNAQSIVTQSSQIGSVSGLIASLKEIVEQSNLSTEDKQTTRNGVNEVEAEMQKPQPDGNKINDRLMKLVTLGGKIALATMQLVQTPVIQTLIRKAMG